MVAALGSLVNFPVYPNAIIKNTPEYGDAAGWREGIDRSRFQGAAGIPCRAEASAKADAGRSNFSGQPKIGATRAMSLPIFVGEGDRKSGLLLN
jgi:hypothetical protein